MMRTYDEFRSYYEKTHAASVPVLEVVASEYPSWLRYVVGLMFVSAALLSGVHTISTVRDGIPDGGIISSEFADLVAQGSFLAVELALFVGAYALIGARRWRAALMLLLAGGVAMTANVLSVNKAFSEDGNSGGQLVALILGIGAPLIAMVAGELFVSMYSADMAAEKKAKETYRSRMIDFDAEVLEAWNAYKKKYRLNDLSSESAVPSLPSTSNGIPLENLLENEPKVLPSISTLGHSKQPQASKIVRDFFTGNPDALNGNPLEIAARLSVGKSTVYNVMNEMRAERISTNGHGQS